MTAYAVVMRRAERAQERASNSGDVLACRDDGSLRELVWCRAYERRHYLPESCRLTLRDGLPAVFRVGGEWLREAPVPLP